MTSATDEFLNREALTFSVMAAFGRARIYASGASEGARAHVRQDLEQLLQRIGRRYRTPVDEREHVFAIEEIAARISEMHAASLRSGYLRIGPAQKALNLYLKYLWAFGWIPTPPHCPLDAVILGRLPGCTNIRWTQMKEIGVYLDRIAAARKVAGARSIADWEVAQWNSV